MSELIMGWPVPPEDDVKPVIDNRFELQSILGMGGLGEVFLALDFAVDPPRQVALKRLHAELLKDSGAVEQLQREAKFTSAVNHPNILKIYYAQFRPDTAYIVTELARQPLSKIELPLPLDIVADYLERLASALDYAHSQGLLHRDIKPENVLTGDLGKIMLADFSLAVAFDKNLPHYATIPAEAWGTPFYAAPEVWNGQICKASDNYALGILIYQLVVGRTPFDGTPDELEQLHLVAPVPKLAYFCGRGIHPTQLDEVFARVLHKDPAQRPASNLEFYRMFQAALQTRRPINIHTNYSEAELVYPISVKRAPPSFQRQTSTTNYIPRNEKLAQITGCVFLLCLLGVMPLLIILSVIPLISLPTAQVAFAWLVIVMLFLGILHHLNSKEAD